MSRRLLALLLALAFAPSALAVQPGFRIYADEVATAPPLQRLLVGSQYPKEVPLSELTAQGYATGAALEAASSWTFVQHADARDVVIQMVPLDPAWTCSLPDPSHCGFDHPGAEGLLATDSFYPWGDPAYRSVSVVDWVPASATTFLRASVIDEDDDSEVRLCLSPVSGHPEFPLMTFPDVANNRRYMALGDPTWQSGAFDCDQAVTTGAPCGGAGGTHVRVSGTQPGGGRVTTRIVRTGTVTLPSGHVLDAMLLESLTDYRLHLGDLDTNCLLSPVGVHAYQLTWLVPHYGALVSFSSNQDTPSLASWTNPEAGFIGAGLLPPLSIQVDASTATSLTVSWNPGTIAPRTSGHVVHWGTVSGHVQAPQSESPLVPAGTDSYTITGLQPDTQYFVSVSSAASYQDRVSGVVTSYRSIELPKSIGADSNGDGVQDTSYPPEVAARTSAIGCVKGDVSPSGVGDGVVTLSDFVVARRKAVGTIALTSRDTTCGDVSPGVVTCDPATGPSDWCVTGDGAFSLGDVVVIRRLVTGVLHVGCASCRVAASSCGPRPPGDVVAAEGSVDVGDAVATLRASVGLLALDARAARAADVAPFESPGIAGGDGIVSIEDVVGVLRDAVGLQRIAWPQRVLRFEIDAPDADALLLTIDRWPSDAVVESLTIDGCDEDFDRGGDRVALACASLAPADGPRVATIRYRASAPLDPSTLTPSCTTLRGEIEEGAGVRLHQR